MKTTSRYVTWGLVIALLGLQGVAMAQVKGYSHVRIVRLSFVDGTVLVKRPNSSEWAKALVNTPIEQGFTVSTSNGSYAEAQFENGSTARVGESSRIDFAELALAPNGDKINNLVFDQGYGTFNFVPKHGDEYTVQAGNTTITPRGKSEFRVDLQQDTVRVEVSEGSVKVKTPDRMVTLGKDRVLEFNTGNEEALNVTSGIQADAWDKWVHGRDQQTALALGDSAVGMNSPVYGWSDLDEYGEWGMFPGYGYGWAPFEPLGWSPFSLGAWSSYSGWGPTWISSEPWGWLPYHYGFWNYDPSFGYFWMPGAGGFNTFYPGLVDWYAAPGYIAWAPVGAGGRPVCTTSQCVTTVKRDLVQNGGLITRAERAQVNLSQFRPVSSLNLAPSPLARLSGTPVGRETQLSGVTGQRTGTGSAPNILLMGQTPAQAAKEMSTLSARRSFFRRALSSSQGQLIQARLGNTLGGHYAITGNGLRSLGESQVRYDAGRMTSSGPVFLRHASENSGHAMARVGGDGGIRAESRGSSGGFSGESGQGGFGGGPSVSSAPSGTSHGVSAPSGGGGHGH
jgi:hypothetical protein